MRPGGAGFSAAASSPTSAASEGAAHSAWHSPVPYLFGGLAAMLGLIAFALLILACSYWKLSGYLDADAGSETGGDSASGGGGDDGDGRSDKPGPCRFFEESIVVIMAGDCKPTFLATPTGASAVASLAGRCGDGATVRTAEEEGKKAGAPPALSSPPPGGATRSPSGGPDCDRNEAAQNVQ